MSLRTSLVLAGDSSGAERALKNVDQALDRAEKGAKELAAASQTAKGAIDALGSEAGTAASEMNSAGEAASKMAADAQRSAAAAMTASAGIKEIGATAGLARHHVMNLAFQAQDLGVQMMMAAQSGNPLQMMLMALMMQGSQIYGIMMQAGIGVKGLAAELARMIGLVTVSSDAVATAAAAEAAANRAVFASLAQRANSAATAASAELVLAETAVALATSATAAAEAQKRLALANADVTKTSAEAAIANAALGAADADATVKGNAAIASRVVSISRLGVVATGVAVVLGVLFAAFKLFQSSVEKTDSAERYVATLGLTAKEAKKLTDVHVTMGDVFKGVWKTISEGLGLEKVFSSIKAWAIDAFTTVLGWAKNAAAGIYAGFAGTFNALSIIWQRFPQIMGEVVTVAANASLAALETMVNFGITKINTLIASANAIGAAFGFNFNIGQIEAVKFGRVAVQNAGTVKKAGQDMAAGYRTSFSSAIGWMDATGAKLTKEILGARNARLKAQADEIKANRSATDAQKKQIDELAKALAALERELNGTEREIEKSIQEDIRDWISDQVKVADEARKALQEAGERKWRVNMDESREASRQATQEMLDDLARISEAASDAANSMSSAFGRVGGAIGSIISILADYKERQAEIASLVATRQKTEAEGSQMLANLQMRNTGQMISAAKTLFKEHSTGYKVMAAAEKAFALVQLANTAINVAAGASKMFAMLGPFAFPAVAAMVAVMAALGFSGGGGGANYKPPNAEAVQSQIGTGTVAGDSSAQSASLANAMKIVADNTNRDLEYSSEAVGYLRDISTGIDKLTVQIGRQIGMSGSMFDTSSFGLGSTGSSGLLGVIGAKSTTRTLYDQGLETFTQTVGDILAQGVNAQVYNVIEQVKKKSGFLGIGGGTKTTYETATGAVPAAIEAQFQAIVGDITKSVIAFGNQLGLDVTEQVKNVALPATKLSFLDMSGEEIEQALEAYFSAIADTITTGLNGTDGLDLSALQKVGEGLYETLARVVKTLTTVNVSLSSIGMGPLSVGGNSGVNVTAPAADNLAGKFGGLSEFQDAVSKFAEGFLSEAERMAPVITAVRDEMARLGQAGVTTNDEFKRLVLGLDLGTEAGQQMFASLLAVAPAFNKVTEYLGSLDGELGQSGKTAAELAQIAKQSRAIDIAMMEATGNAAGALAAKRADELAAMDESLRAKQQALWAAQDEAEAARAAATVNSERRNLEIRLMEASGDAAGALAAKRAAELDAVDASNRAILEAIFAAEDLAAAQEALAESTRAATEIANERRSLEIRLMEASGDAAGALAAKRAEELASVDASNRVTLEAIYAAEDYADAQEAVAEALKKVTEIADERRGLEIRLMEATGDAAGALAAKRAEELASVDASNRSILEAIFAAEDYADAQDAVAKALEAVTTIANERRSLEIRLMEASGDAHGALIARRAEELASVDASNRSLLEMIFTAEDAKAAQDALAEAQRGAADAARAASELNIRLLEAQGNTDAALAARRQLELAGATDEATRATLRLIYAAEDEAKIRAKQEADAKTAQANEQAAIREAKQAAEEEARRLQEIADKRAGLEIQLMRALGKESEALAAERARELDGMDASLRGIQQQVWAAQDAAKAQEELAKAQADAAAKAEQLAKDRLGLQIRILEMEGFTAEAIALKRQQELAAMDESLRPLQLRIYALEDAKAAEEAHAEAVKEAADKVAKARDAVADAYDREAGALKDTMERFRAFGASLREFRASLTVGNDGIGDVYRVAQARFVDAASAARMGDEQALGSLADISKAFLDASRNNAGSLADYQRDVARVAQATDAAIAASDEAANYAELELEALNLTVKGIIDLDETMVSVRDAIVEFHKAVAEQGGLAAPAPVQIVPPVATSTPQGAGNAELAAKLGELIDNSFRGDVAVVDQLKRIFDILDRADGGDFLRIGNDPDTPITMRTNDNEPLKVEDVTP